MLQLAGLCAWPTLIARFLIQNQKKLYRKEIRQKWGTIYQGIHLNNLEALMYNAVFCV